MTIPLLSKRAGEVRRYQHDWSPFLGLDTIASEDTTATGATVSVTVSDDAQSVVFAVSGGVAGVPARIVHTITTAAGDDETEEFVIPIGYDEPVSLRDAKAQCRMLEDDSEDEFILSLIAPARAYVERITRNSYVVGVRTQTFNAFGDFLEIARKPITEVTDPIVYTDEAGADADYSGFLAPLGRYPLRIYPGIDASFPALGDGGLITVTYTTGSVSETSEEYLIGKRAILLLIGYWFENRGEVPLDKDTELALDCVLNSLAPLSAY